jgi:hypothetical protein
VRVGRGEVGSRVGGCEGVSPPPVHLETESWVVLGEWGACEDPANEAAMTRSSARLGVVSECVPHGSAATTVVEDRSPAYKVPCAPQM